MSLMVYLFLQAAVKALSGLLAFFALVAAGALFLRKARESALVHLPRGVLSVLLACAVVAAVIAQKDTSRAPARSPRAEPTTLVAGNVSDAEAQNLFPAYTNAVTNLRFTSIGCSTNGVALSVAWDGGAFALPPFLEFFARTNLLAGTWDLVGWTQAAAGETNLDVVVEADRLPGGVPPPAAFFAVTASDGLGGDEADDDRDGLTNAEERARGTNPRRADTDGDGLSDGEELSFAATGGQLPEFDLSALPDVCAGTLPFDVYPAAFAVDLPFAVGLTGHRATRAVVHFCGVVTFLEAGTAVDAASYSHADGPDDLYAASHAVVAAYGFPFLMMGYTGAQLRAGIVHASDGRWFVAEWRNMQDPMGFAYLTFGAATFRLAVSEADPTVVHVSYLSLSGDLDGTDALIGAHGFGGEPDLLVADGVAGSVASGLVLSYRFGTGTDPLMSDTDGDGLKDGWEAAHGMDPRTPNDASADPRLAPWADPDRDGLTNLQESELGTDPFQPDSDGDCMDDGWEAAHGFDPAVHNADTPRTDDDPDADPDRDGLTNRQECEWRTNPGARDTDRDGVFDGTEVAQNGDPADATDGGRPNSRVPVPFTFGDPSTSHSEKYELRVEPIVGNGSGQDTPPRGFVWISQGYGQCETRTAMLKPGWRYSVRLAHASTNLENGPDYDYLLEVPSESLPPSVVLSDPNGLLGSHSASDVFTAAGKVAHVDVYALAFVTPAGDPVSEPRSEAGTGQNEFTYDDASASLSLSLKARVVPSPPEGRIGAFTLPDIEGTMLEWENSSNGSATANGGEFTVRATYRGYPTHNSGFGRKTATFTLGGLTISQDFEVFFPKFGKNHPPCTTCPNCSNWFYYWREGDVCSIPGNTRWCEQIDGDGNIIAKYDVTSGGILLTDMAANEEDCFSLSASLCVTQTIYEVVHEFVEGALEVKPGSAGMAGHRYYVQSRQEIRGEDNLILANLGGRRKGVAYVAAVIAHEQCHGEIIRESSRQIEALSLTFDDKANKKDEYGEDSLEYAEAVVRHRLVQDGYVDEDGDGVHDGGEVGGYLGILSDPHLCDTYDIAEKYPVYRSSGDNEVRARRAESQMPSDRYRVDYDWSNPGSQHKEPYGP